MINTFDKQPDYNFPTEVAECKRLLKLEGVSDAIIDECFIPDETETAEEVMGSVIMAIKDAGIQEMAAHRIIDTVFNQISPFTVPVEEDTFIDIVNANGLPISEVIA